MGDEETTGKSFQKEVIPEFGPKGLYCRKLTSVEHTVENSLVGAKPGSVAEIQMQMSDGLN